MENKIAYHINKRRETFLRFDSKLGGSWIKITKTELLALAEQVKDKSYITDNWNIQDLSKKYKNKGRKNK